MKRSFNTRKVKARIGRQIRLCRIKIVQKSLRFW